MSRHADSISEWNNLFTNLPNTGRLGVHTKSRQDSLEGKRAVVVDGPARNNRALFARVLATVVLT